jgi:hypothetical protein
VATSAVIVIAGLVDIASVTCDAVVEDASWSKPLPRHLLAATPATVKGY